MLFRSALSGLWQIAKTASWMLPHRRVCWLAERPRVLRGHSVTLAEIPEDLLAAEIDRVAAPRT